MKLILQIIGFIVVVAILFGLVFFFLDSKSLLRGDFANYIHTMHDLWQQAVKSTISFMQSAGIANDAADLLDHGADMLRSIDPSNPQATPSAEASVGPIIIDARPTETPPAIIIITPVP
ncbi:MAG: hypothetical protein IJK14_05410 [Clostridia bacterium]|nr:hypothetical protein [Clostridia bacterium]